MSKAAYTRDWISIQSFLKRKGVTQRTIGRSAKVHHSLVTKTLRGQRNSRKVLDALRRAGVPEELLGADE